MSRGGSQTVADQHTVLIDYMGGCNHVFNQFHLDMFTDELRCICGDLRPETASERNFGFGSATHTQPHNELECMPAIKYLRVIPGTSSVR